MSKVKLSRRRFLQLGAAAAAAAALEVQTGGVLTALGHELTPGGKDVRGGKAHVRGRVRAATATTCLQCGVTDGLLAYTEGEGRRKRIVKLEGNPKNPNTRNKLCAKGQAGFQQVYDPFRIRYPIVRDPEKRGDPKAWRRISWEEAVDEVAKRLNDIRRDKEPGRFVFHQGRNRFAPFTKRFTNAFGTKHYFTHTTICESSLKKGYITTFGQDLDASDVINTNYIISWGENIYEAAYMHNPLAQRIAEARVGPKKPKMVAIDPRLTQTAGAADEWIAPKPGTDAAMMLAMCHVIMRENLHDAQFLDTWTNYPSARLKAYLAEFTPEWAEEICGVSSETIERIAVEFAQNQPGYARAYNGISNHANGTYNARCLALLNAVVGNVEKEGGFCLMKFTGFGAVDPEPNGDDVIKADGLKNEFPLLEDFEKNYPLAEERPAHLMPHVLERTGFQVGLYLLHQYNPVYVNPDREAWLEAMKDPKKIAFIVDFSPFVSETVQEVADLVIPDCTYLERLQINDMPPVENFPFVHVFQPVIDPLYETRSMYDTMLAIAKKVEGMEKYFAFNTVEEYCRTAVEGKWGPGSWDRLKQDGVLINPSRNFADPPVKPADRRYKTYDQLTPEELNRARQFNTYADRLDLAALQAQGAQFPPGDGPIKDAKGEKTLGAMKGGVAFRGFPTGSGLWETFSQQLADKGFEPLPVYKPVKTLQNLEADQFVLTSGKWNVHTQSRTANSAWLMEFMHYNPLWINTADAERLDIESGEEVELTSDFGTKKMTCRVYVTEGIRPGVLFLSTSLGHWEYGPMASHGKDPFAQLPHQDFTLVAGIQSNVDADWFKDTSATAAGMKDIWWMQVDHPGDSRGKTPLGRDTVGWSPNWIMPADDDRTDPIGGEYAWSGTPVRIRKTSSSSSAVLLGGSAIAAAGTAAALYRRGPGDLEARDGSPPLETREPEGGEAR